MDEQLKDIDKHRIIAVERLYSCLTHKLDTFSHKGFLKLVSKHNSQGNKRYGFSILHSLLQRKDRSDKVATMRVFRRITNYYINVRKYCWLLLRMDNRLQGKRNRDTFLRLKNHVNASHDQSNKVTPSSRSGARVLFLIFRGHPGTKGMKKTRTRRHP